jgi:hypothetical protein
MKLRNVIVIILVNGVLFTGAWFAADFSAQDRLPRTRAQFLTKEQVVFYQKYAAELNHLRSFDFERQIHPDAEKNTENFLFSKIGGGKRTVLIQGDSWAEQLMLSHQSFVALQIFSEEHDLQFIVGGTASYAPSIMAVQYRLLRNDFSIHPDIIVGILDQTDIGDELCRYPSQLSKNASGEDIVLPYNGTELVPYFLTQYFNLIDILDGPGSALTRLIKYRMAKSEKMLPSGCNQEILSPLEGLLSEPDRRYVETRINNYIQEVFRKPNEVQKLVLVTHFHKNHQTGRYKVSIAELVKKTVDASVFKDRIVQVNFEPQDYANEDESRIFKIGDPYSHLTDYMHRKVFTRKILHIVNTSLP